MKSGYVVTFGEVLMRLSAPHFTRLGQTETLTLGYGGSESNVAVGLCNFGVPTVHVTRFPENDFGQAATQHLRHFGVDTRHIVYGKERMGLYFFEQGASQRPSRIVYDRFDSSFANIQKGAIDWGMIFKDASRFHWSGITPAISQGAADVCREALQIAVKMGLTVSGDINYRRNLWQYGKTAIQVMPSFIELSHLIVASSVDMANCAAIQGDSFESSCRQLMKSFPNVKKIAATERETTSSSQEKLTGVLWDGKELITSRQYAIAHVVDRVGAGDAFMAGLIYGEMKGMGDLGTLDFATASCVLKHTVAGDVSRVSVEEVDLLIRGENIGKLLR